MGSQSPISRPCNEMPKNQRIESVCRENCSLYAAWYRDKIKFEADMKQLGSSAQFQWERDSWYGIACFDFHAVHHQKPGIYMQPRCSVCRFALDHLFERERLGLVEAVA